MVVTVICLHALQYGAAINNLNWPWIYASHCIAFQLHDSHCYPYPLIVFESHSLPREEPKECCREVNLVDILYAYS